MTILRLKYGENPWQEDAEYKQNPYRKDDPLALHQFGLMEGKEPSYNIFTDLDRALQTITHIAAAFSRNLDRVSAIAVGIKHGNPCGAAIADDPREALRLMIEGDPLSLFGGFVITNFSIGERMADLLSGYPFTQLKARRILDGIAAPDFESEAKKILSRKDGKCRMFANPALTELHEQPLDLKPRIRYVRGGMLVQQNYTYVLDLDDAELQITGKILEYDDRDFILAWAIGSTSNSNTITLVKNGKLIGNGVGQQDRVGACKLAVERAQRSGHDIAGALAYSDSFFPFTDGIDVLADAGVKIIFTSRRSNHLKRDAEIAEQCNKRGIVLWTLPDAKCRGFFGH
ncbi:MAG: hypothetical protein HYT22_03625 [Candidatus Niyogibacteria bacterium]|nr:hypothetical protein [Candidatus Niyogibacteria bacterium]